MTRYPVRFGIQSPQQHGSWPELVALWRDVDTLGFDSAWVFDHFLPIFSDPTGPCLEGWTSLAALAMVTQHMRLGVLVTGNPTDIRRFGQNGDGESHQSGRLILGLGAGWFELNTPPTGSFPSVRERLPRLDEALTVITRLWTEDRVTLAGRYIIS
jgi:alkanesulfonate monooxygenase SsuD/methylene tetrahydromethanopterin reductase-like flavin-dependent oxidoreductase (luciferase family)